MKKSRTNKIYRAIGLMSGTSLDGIDAAMIETDGYDYVEFIDFETQSYDQDFRHAIRACLNKTQRDHTCLSVEKELTLRHANIINKLINKVNINNQHIDIVGFHGQTIHHDPEASVTIQLGDGALLAQETGIDVVYDLRSADIKNGGQGAPLLPVYHRALAMQNDLDFPVLIANIGGVSNISWIDADGEMIAFDTGPGNAMIDDWIRKHTGSQYDTRGALAAQGVISQGKMNEFLSLSYFSKNFPKSLDRNEFNRVNVDGLSPHDGAATLTEMAVQSLMAGIKLCPEDPKAIYITGGGRHNDFMMQRLNDVAGIPVKPVEVLGWRGDSMEAEGFAYMAVRHLLMEPTSFTGTTGCVSPTIGGCYVPAPTKSKTA